MTRISILFGCLLLCCQCDPGERKKENLIVHGTKVGVLDAALTPTLRYGVGIDLGWSLSPHLVYDAIRIYRGAAESGCEEFALLDELPAGAQLFEDRGLVIDQTYAYCLTVAHGDYQTLRTAAPVASLQYVGPLFVLNHGLPATTTSQVPLEILVHPDRFDPVWVVMRLGDEDHYVDYNPQVVLDFAGMVGPLDLELWLVDGDGNATTPQPFSLIVCTGASLLADADGDGFYVGATPESCPGLQLDCDDSVSSIHPGALEICDGKDQDCDGQVDENLGTTSCGVGPCVHQVPSCTGGQPTACDPLAGATAELCDGIDNDCDGTIDDGLDEDQDGYGRAGASGCPSPGVDCNDANAGVYPGAFEIPQDGVDQDCDGQTDEEDCDGIDNDGDGLVDEGYDLDGDGVAGCSFPGSPITYPDCDDTAGGGGTGVCTQDQVCTSGGLRNVCRTVWKSFSSPAGFSMGLAGGSTANDEPVHAVTLAPFAIHLTEVTVEAYRRCVNASACTAPRSSTSACNWGKPNRESHPVNCVNWTQARTYCQWAGGRLPSEAEWEYAARNGGQNITYPWADSPAPDCTRVVMVSASSVSGCDANTTFPVCSKASGNTGAQVDGLCDMAGNVWEWVADKWHDSYTGAPPSGSAWVEPDGIDNDGDGRIDESDEAETGNNIDDDGDARVDEGANPTRVRRGGGYSSSNTFRATYRNSGEPQWQYPSIGFRCAKTL